MEKIESVLRAKLQALNEDVNLNRGQAQSLHKDQINLLKTMEKLLVTLQSLMDGIRYPWHRWGEHCLSPLWTVRADQKWLTSC